MSGNRKSLKQVMVPCPARIQRYMLQNLERSSRDIVNLDRAKKSRKIFEALKNEREKG